MGDPEAGEDMWRCSVCTFDNPLDSATCDICDTPREELSETSTTSKGSGTTSIPIFVVKSLFLLYWLTKSTIRIPTF